MRGSPWSWKAWCRPEISIIYYLRWCRSSRQYILGWLWNPIFRYHNDGCHSLIDCHHDANTSGLQESMSSYDIIPVSTNQVARMSSRDVCPCLSQIRWSNSNHFKLKNSNWKVLNFHKYTVSTNCNMGLKHTLIYLPHCYMYIYIYICHKIHEITHQYAVQSNT